MLCLFNLGRRCLLRLFMKSMKQYHTLSPDLFFPSQHLSAPHKTLCPYNFHLTPFCKVNQSVYKIKLFAKLHTVSFRKTEIKKRVKKFTFLYFRHERKRTDSQRGNEKGRPGGVTLWLCGTGCDWQPGKAHATALSVGVFDAADVTGLITVVLEHEDSTLINPHETFPQCVIVRRQSIH